MAKPSSSGACVSRALPHVAAPIARPSSGSIKAKACTAE